MKKLTFDEEINLHNKGIAKVVEPQKKYLRYKEEVDLLKYRKISNALHYLHAIIWKHRSIKDSKDINFKFVGFDISLYKGELTSPFKLSEYSIARCISEKYLATGLKFVIVEYTNGKNGYDGFTQKLDFSDLELAFYYKIMEYPEAFIYLYEQAVLNANWFRKNKVADYEKN